MARTFYVEITTQVSPTSQIEALETFLDHLMERLQDEPGADDADVGVDMTTGRLDFCLHLQANDAAAALRSAQVIARSAAHAAGAATPGWEKVAQAIEDDDLLALVRPAEGEGDKSDAATEEPAPA